MKKICIFLAALCMSFVVPIHDVMASSQETPWYIQQIHADNVWERTGMGLGIDVAVIDFDGIDKDHEDLAAENFRDIPTEPGIYFVRWLKNGKLVAIPRLGDIDSKGILYIGSAAKLKKRIRELWKGINGQVEAHTVGKTIIFCKISEIISPSEYQVSWEELRTHEDAIGQEWSTIEYYAVRCRETPPLNLMLRRHMFIKTGLWITGRSRIGYKPDEFVKSSINS